MVSSPKQQRALLENYFNECFKKNQQRGREGRYPITYRECHNVVKEVLAAAQVTYFSNFYSGDPYIGGREDLLKKNEEIASLQKEVKQLRSS